MKRLILFLLLILILIFLISCTESLDENMVKLTVKVDGEGEGTVEPPVGIHDYSLDSVVELKATPTQDYEFSKWEGDVTDQNSATTQINMNEDHVVTAVFKIKTLEGTINIDTDLQAGPPQVSNLQAVQDNESVNLTWSQMPETVYYILYQNSDNNFDTAKRIKDIDGNKTSIILDELVEGTYYFWLEGYNSDQLASPISDSVNIVIQ